MPPKLLAAYNDSGGAQRYDEDGKPIKPKTIQNYVTELMDVFLPVGYPESVTPDYTPYQIYVCLAAVLRWFQKYLLMRPTGFPTGLLQHHCGALVLPSCPPGLRCR